MDTAWLTLPVTGGLIGWVTNRLALWALFRPVHPWRVPVVGWTVQGLLPRRQADLARALAEAVERDLLTAADVRDHLRRLPLDRAAADAVAQMAREAVLARMPAWLPRSWSTQLADRVAQAAGLEVRRRFPELAEGLLAAAGEGLRLGPVVERKLLELDPAGVEALVVRLAGRELRFVEWSGALLGFLVGLLQALLVSL
ncbi:MAG: hypothetical protein DIU76_03015 [Bacillota bacterium]|nr:MAG: hypothetical protein DIU76_03015 [Bacillota bacterium]